MSGLKNISPLYWAFLAGIGSAAFSLIPLSAPLFIILLNYFTQLPLYLVGLAFGLNIAFIACISAMAIFAVIAGPITAGVFMGIHGVPVLLLLYKALSQYHCPDGRVIWYPAGLLVSWLTGLAMVGTVLFGIWLVSANITPSQLIDSWLKLLIPVYNVGTVHLNAPQLLYLIPGIIGMAWVLMGVMNLHLAQKILMNLKINLRPFPTADDLEMLEIWDLILVIFILISLLGKGVSSFIGQNLAFLACMPLLFLGSRVIYTYSQRFNNAHFLLIIFFFFTFLLVWPALFIVGLGVLEPWLHLRKRLAVSRGNKLY